MARIRTYALDNNVTGSDYWIGTDGNDNSNTKNFSPNSVAQYLNENEIIDVSNSVRFKYDTIDSGQQRKDGTISFQNEIGATVPMSDLSSFVLSKKTQSGKDVSFFLNVLPTTKVILHKSNDINIFGLYRVLSVTTDLVEPNFFNVSLEFISGHGSIEEDKDYIISLIDLNKTIPVLQLTKETFNYASSSSFTLSNTIGNILQVIINTTSLHPEGYSYTLPSTVTILNELHAGDVITVVYNYLEEFLEVPDLQRVTNIGNHTTNNIIIDNIPGEWGSYAASNTLNELGVFQSFTSPTSSPDYQTTYAGYEMSISEIYTPIERKEVLIYSGIVQASYINGSNYNALRLNSGDNSNGPSFYIEKNNINGQLRIDNLIGNTILQFPAKPTGTYTIATTDDVSPNHWTKTGNIIRNNNTGNIEFFNANWYVSPSGYGKFANLQGSYIYANVLVELPNAGKLTCDGDGTNYIQGFRDSHWLSDIKFKYLTDLSSTYDDRSLVDKGYITTYTTAQLAGKMNIPSLTASYIPKALTATTIGNSRLLDTGTYLGIGTVNAPTKDITLGYQANREIGIELSDSTTIGRDLTVTAGKTVNYSLNSDFVALNQAANSWWGVCGHVNGNVYATVNSGAASGGIYTQTGGIGNFNQTTSNFASQIFSITCLPNGNIYVVTSFPGIYKQTNATGSFVADATAPTVSSASILASDTNNNIYLLISGGAIYKKTNDTGSFVLISITARNYNFITCHPNGNVYASVSNGDIYMQTGGIGDFNPLSQTSRTWSALACTSNGNVYAYASSSIYIQTAGTGNFVLQSGLTARNYIRLGADINGNMYGTGTDIYKQINATLGTPNLQGGTLKITSGTGKGTGASDIEMWTGQVLASGTDMQTATLRAKINNEGLMTLPSVTNDLIEADTTGKSVATKEYVNNRLVLEKSGNYTLTNADSGGIIIFTASATLTIPTGLADGFECTFVTLSGVTLTVVSTGNTLNNATSTTMLPQLSFTLKRMLATDQYIATGSL